MPFSPQTKASMFIRCGRKCCLCLKQCGTNIEAAHIIAEAKGGSNDEDNGIPVCLDCHQEIGAYDDSHPKGNKFTPDELRDRRDYVYELVKTGQVDKLSNSGGDVALSGVLRAGDGNSKRGGDITIEAGTGFGGASGGSVDIGHIHIASGRGGSGGRGGDVNIKAGDAK